VSKARYVMVEVAKVQTPSHAERVLRKTLKELGMSETQSYRWRRGLPTVHCDDTSEGVSVTKVTIVKAQLRRTFAPRTMYKLSTSQ
jgi:hypothetical protein